MNTIPHNGTQTSIEAARSMRLAAATQEARVYDYIKSRGAEGATDDEGQRDLGIDAHSYCPRRISLERKACIRKTDRTRPTRSGRRAAVWVVQEAA